MMSAPLLDHLVLLVPSLASASTSFASASGLEIIPGGTLADGVTENVLVVFPDGVCASAFPSLPRCMILALTRYIRRQDIELIAFTTSSTPAARANHWWGDKADGWIDWALCPAPASTSDRIKAVNAKAGSKIYQEPVDGGRLTKQGRQLEWKVAFPVLEVGQTRGVRPFWCGDVTERAWRVSLFIRTLQLGRFQTAS